MAEAQPLVREEAELPPPGRRWGAGAHSVLPYLTKSLQAKPAPVADGRESRGRGAAQQQDGSKTHPRA